MFGIKKKKKKKYKVLWGWENKDGTYGWSRTGPQFYNDIEIFEQQAETNGKAADHNWDGTKCYYFTIEEIK